MQISRYPERGIREAKEVDRNRSIDRQKWLEEVFPEWGHYLNNKINNTTIKPGTVALWWFGGPSWALKSAGGRTFLIDNYSGSSLYSKYEYCGVCKTSGAKSLDWIRINPHVIDPWAFSSLDAVFCTHHHQDHCDIYTIKATSQTTRCKFVGPKVTAEKISGWYVPKERIVQVKPGDNLKFGDVNIKVLMNYDKIARITGEDKICSFEEVAVSYLFQTSGGNILFLGDTLYYNGYKAIGDKYDIDVVILNMGHNAPGVTDKLSPFDAFRVAQAVGAKIVIPDHYDNWASSQIDPRQLERIVKENDLSIKTVILQWGARFIYPDDQNIGHYKYPDWRERFRSDYSWEYGEPEKKE